MAADASKNVTRTQTMTSEKRGGYGSSSKPVTKLAPPPKGTAPGASAKSGTPGKSK
jgi:hypothetical protein